MIHSQSTTKEIPVIQREWRQSSATSSGSGASFQEADEVLTSGTTTVDSKSVLLVDDNPHVRTIVRLMLSAAGFAVTEAEDGATALNLLLNREFAVLITDLIMPGFGGVELIERAREVNQSLPILAISGSVGSPEYIKAASLLGSEAILPKPFDNATLVSTVRSLATVRM